MEKEAMETNADKAVEMAEDHVRCALVQLSHAVNNEIEGYDGYVLPYQDDLDEALNLLRRVKRLLRVRKCDRTTILSPQIKPG